MTDGRIFLLEIGFAPAAPDSREALELVLGAAALELPVAVLFRGAGTGHLLQPAAAEWRQITDHDLADLYHTGGARPPDLPARALAGEELAGLRAGARCIMAL